MTLTFPSTGWYAVPIPCDSQYDSKSAFAPRGMTPTTHTSSPRARTTFAAEIFVRIGLEIKQWSPSEATFVAELANARASTYVPTTDQAERGAYGAKPILSRWLCADAGRRMADAALVMLHRMFRVPMAPSEG